MSAKELLRFKFIQNSNRDLWETYKLILKGIWKRKDKEKPRLFLKIMNKEVLVPLAIVVKMKCY